MAGEHTMAQDMAREQQAATRARSDHVLDRRYAQGMANGSAAATADALGTPTHNDVLQMAWDVSAASTDVLELAQQEEYCIGWAHGYTRRAGEIEGAPDTWEDDGGRIA